MSNPRLLHDDAPRERDEEVEFTPEPAVEIARPRRIERRGSPKTRGRFRRRESNGSKLLGGSVRWSAMAGLGAALALLLLGWSALQVTSRENASRVLEETLTSLTEVDALLDQDYVALVAEARERGTEPITVPHYAVEVTIPANELATMSKAALRARLLSVGADRLYDEGLTAFEREPGSTSDELLSGDIFSARGIFRLTVGQLRSGSHDVARLVVIVAAVLTAIALVLVLRISEGPRRLRNLGVGVLVGTVPVGLALIGFRFGLRIVADGVDDPFSATLLDTGSEVFWIPVRNFLIFASLGALIVVGATALKGWEDRGEATPADGRLVRSR